MIDTPEHARLTRREYATLLALRQYPGEELALRREVFARLIERELHAAGYRADGKKGR